MENQNPTPESINNLLDPQFETSGHSYTEAGFYSPDLDKLREPKKFKLSELMIHHLDALQALAKLLELHDRETNGDETITHKEWLTAIKAGKEALEK